MSEQSNPYSVTINGNVYGFAQGDSAVAQAGSLVNNKLTPFMTPPLPSQGIFGRNEFLTRIFEDLDLQDEKVQNVPPLALLGMGGIGKTTLMIALGRLQVVRNSFPDGIMWAELGVSPSVRLILDAWGRSLGIDLLAERDEAACRDRLRAVISQRRMLILVDDVWNAAHGSFFAVGGPLCRTLFTTRELEVANTLATGKRIAQVDLLGQTASLDLLLSLAPQAVAGNEEKAIQLCQKLEFLPLGLTLAGRYLAIEWEILGNVKETFDQLIENRKMLDNLVDAAGRPYLPVGQPASLWDILGRSVERLSRVDQERFAMAAVFGEEPLTWEINAAAAVWECSVEEARKTIGQFIRRGLVVRRGERYWMHALLANYATRMLEELGL